MDYTVSLSQWSQWIDLFYFPSLSLLYLHIFRYSCSLQLIGLTSARPVSWRYEINRFSQHEIVAHLMHQQHKLFILNFTSQEAQKSEFVTKQDERRVLTPRRWSNNRRTASGRILTFGFYASFTKCSIWVILTAGLTFKGFWDSGETQCLLLAVTGFKQ